MRRRPWRSAESIQAHRKALLDIMTRFIPVEDVRFNKRLTDIEQHPDKVVLSFADGEIAHASVVAGADGISSMVRRHILGPLHPTQVDPVYADAYCYRAVIPIQQAEDILGDLTDVAKFYFGYDRSAVTYRISGGEASSYQDENLTSTDSAAQEFNFLLCVADDNPWAANQAVTTKVSNEAMMADFKGPTVDKRFLCLLSKASPTRWGLFHHPHTSTYYRDRVVILGDSAHASLPFQAAGAAQGVEDAVVLSNVLAELSHNRTYEKSPLVAIRAALDAFDYVRRPRAQKQLEQSAEVNRMLFFRHEQAGSDMNKILPMLQNRRFDWLWFHDIEEDVRVAISRMKPGSGT